MGYTTEFTGVINLSRKLTMAEAKELLEIADDVTHAKSETGIDAYFQWVPTETLDGIVWDGNEKFYSYVECLGWLCEDWLKNRDIEANGMFYWQGEETGDTGTISVMKNVVVATASPKPDTASPKPLTLRRLQEMALEQLSAS